MPRSQPVALVLAAAGVCVLAASLAACSDAAIPDTTDAAPDAAASSCSPDCTSGQLCFSTGPGPVDASSEFSCQFTPSACTSNASCDCLGPALCPGAGGYGCNYDALAGYAILQCAN